MWLSRRSLISDENRRPKVPEDVKLKLTEMVPHKIPTTLLDSMTRGPSPTKTKQVAAMQNYIQGLLGPTHHTFLQGSYRNDTAVSDINDVDVVAIRLQTFSSVHSTRRFPTSIPWDAIFAEIEQKLQNQQLYKWTVNRDDKCIKVRGAFNADVVPAVQVNDDHLIDPIVIYSFNAFTEKLNYPRIHYKNGVQKQAATNNLYKQTVRMFKSWAQDHFGASKQIISSFKMEALVHGSNNEYFFDDPAASFLVIANNIIQRLTVQTQAPVVYPSVCGFENIATNWDASSRGIFRTKLQESLQFAIEAYEATTQSAAEEKWRKVFNL